MRSTYIHGGAGLLIQSGLYDLSKLIMAIWHGDGGINQNKRSLVLSAKQANATTTTTPPPPPTKRKLYHEAPIDLHVPVLYM